MLTEHAQMHAGKCERCKKVRTLRGRVTETTSLLQETVVGSNNEWFPE